MNNLENCIKNEYVIVFAEYFSSGITYYVYNKQDKEIDKNLPYYIAYNCGTKYPSKEIAEKKMKELVSKGFFKYRMDEVCNNIVENENLVKSIVKGWFNNDFNKSKAVAVIKIPNSYYLGEYGAYAFELSKLNIPYDNEHRYQCASHRNNKWFYLKVNANNTTEWVESQDKATCMTEKEQSKWCDKMNDIRPYEGYVQPMNLPVRLNTSQKYYKGQKILIWINGNYFYTHINDIMPNIDGKYYYALPSDAIYGGKLSIMSEGCYEGADLYSEDRIMLFDEVVKSFDIKKTIYNNTYYTNVVLNNGTKIKEIAHF